MDSEVDHPTEVSGSGDPETSFADSKVGDVAKSIEDPKFHDESADSISELNKEDDLQSTKTNFLAEKNDCSEDEDLKSFESLNHVPTPVNSLQEFEDEDLILKQKQTVENDEPEEGFDWLEHFFPKKTFDAHILTDNDIVTREQSDLRIIWCLVVTYLLSSMAILGFILAIIVVIQSKTKPLVVIPNVDTMNVFDRGFPMPHFAFVLDDGTVIDVSLYPNRSPSIGTMIKLPKSPMYHGYSDSQGILYFFDSEMRKPITKFHKSFGTNGFQTMHHGFTFEEFEGQKFDHGVSVGSYYWFLFKSPAKTGKEVDREFYRLQTSVWYKKRKQLNPGPKLSKRFNTFADHPGFLTVSLNATHLMVIGYHHKDDESIQDQELLFRRCAVVDFANQVWHQIPMLPAEIFLISDSLEIEFQESISSRKATITISKKGIPQVYVHYEILVTETYTLDTTAKEKLLLFDFSFGEWQIISARKRPWLLGIKAMLNIRGIPTSVLTDGSFIGHQSGGNFYNSHTITALSSKTILNIIPFFA